MFFARKTWRLTSTLWHFLVLNLAVSTVGCGGGRTTLWTSELAADSTAAAAAGGATASDRGRAERGAGAGQVDTPQSSSTGAQRPEAAPTEAGESQPTDVPPGNFVAVMCEDSVSAARELYAIRLIGREGARDIGGVDFLTEADKLTSISWAPDGNHLAFQSRTTLRVADLTGAQPDVTEMGASEIGGGELSTLDPVKWIDPEHLVVPAYTESGKLQLWLATADLEFLDNIADSLPVLRGPGSAYPSPDGTSIIVAFADSSNQVALYLSQRQPGSASEFSHPTEAFSLLTRGEAVGPLDFSPDGAYFAFVPTTDAPLGLGGPVVVSIDKGAQVLTAPDAPEDSATLQVSWAPNTGLLAYLVETVEKEAFVDVYVYDAELGTSQAFLGNLEHRSAGIVGWDATGQALAINGRFGDDEGSSLRILTPAAEESGARHFMQEDFPNMRAMTSSPDRTSVLFVSREQIYSVPYLSTGLFNQLTRAPAPGLTVQNYQSTDSGSVLYWVQEPNDWEPPTSAADTDVTSGGLYAADRLVSTLIKLPTKTQPSYHFLPDQTGALIASEQHIYFLPDVRNARGLSDLNEHIADCALTDYLIPPAWE